MTRTSPSFAMVALLASMVAGSLLALGAAHTPSALVIAGLSSIAAVVTIQSRGGYSLGAIPSPYGILLALAAYSCLQAIPLPLGWVATLSPAAADVWERSLSPIGEAPRWASISLDPGASLLEALKSLTYANVFLVATCLARLRGALPGAAIVFGSASLAALVTLAHGLAGATSVYGVYQPRLQTVPWHLGPLLNPNNLAGYLNLGTFCGLGLLLKRDEGEGIPRWLIALGVASTIGIGVTTGSRGGLVALVLGLFVFALFALKKRRPRGRILGATALSLAVVGGLILALLGATSATWQELLSKDLSKLEMTLWLRPMVEDHLWFGIGRGAFESVFPVYRPPGGNLVFTHVESFPAQWIAEWGLPIGLLALVLLGWAFSPRKLAISRGSLVLGMTIGLGFLFLQNLADLALELPAIGVVVATLLGTLVGRKHPSSTHGYSARARRGWQAATLVAPAVLVGILLASGWKDIATERERIREIVEKGEAHDAPAARQAIVAAMRRHPADPYLPLMGAMVARREGRDPMPWLSRSLERALVNPRAHLLTADVLHSLGRPDQAVLALRIAIAQEPQLSGPVAAMAIRMSRDFERLVSVAKEGAEGALVLEDMARRLGPEEGELRLRLHREAMQRDRTRPGPHIALAEARIREHAASEAAEANDSFVREIEEHANAIERALPDTSDAARLRAGSLVVRGRAEEAEQLLARRCPLVEDELRCLRARVDAAAAAEKAELLPVALKALISRACVTTRDCADASTYAGNLARNRGDRAAALGHFLRAAREDPTEPRWREVARLAAAMGAHAQAAEALEKVARMQGHADPELRRQIDEARMRALSK